METDIVIPVWNRPAETRSCLVNLVNFSPGARLIIVDIGSDRETETLLEEFADLLQERALLLRNDQNVGFVAAVNRGLSKVTAPLVAVVRNTSLVQEGWLEPIKRAVVSRPDAGIVSPRLIPSGTRIPKQGKLQIMRPVEIDSPSFAAMVIRKQLLDRAGGFDEGLDGGEWCLRDYTRRALLQGWHTLLADGSPVLYSDEAAFGSTERREQRLRRSTEVFRERWGEEGRSWFVLFPKTAPLAEVKGALDLLLAGARQGHRFHLPLCGKIARELETAGCDFLHESLRLYHLPRLFPERECRKLWLRLKEEEPGITAVAAGEGAVPADEECLEFARLEQEIVERAQTIYAGRGGERA